MVTVDQGQRPCIEFLGLSPSWLPICSASQPSHNAARGPQSACRGLTPPSASLPAARSCVSQNFGPVDWVGFVRMRHKGEAQEGNALDGVPMTDFFHSIRAGVLTVGGQLGTASTTSVHWESLTRFPCKICLCGHFITSPQMVLKK